MHLEMYAVDMFSRCTVVPETIYPMQTFTAAEKTRVNVKAARVVYNHVLEMCVRICNVHGLHRNLVYNVNLLMWSTLLFYFPCWALCIDVPVLILVLCR